ncbi:hypothetical protein T439DRAFT_226355 [Meredithblackwellia eburnea MCA 4105]
MEGGSTTENVLPCFDDERLGLMSSAFLSTFSRSQIHFRLPPCLASSPPHWWGLVTLLTRLLPRSWTTTTRDTSHPSTFFFFFFSGTFSMGGGMFGYLAWEPPLFRLRQSSSFGFSRAGGSVGARKGIVFTLKNQPSTHIKRTLVFRLHLNGYSISSSPLFFFFFLLQSSFFEQVVHLSAFLSSFPSSSSFYSLLLPKKNSRSFSFSSSSSLQKVTMCSRLSQKYFIFFR